MTYFSQHCLVKQSPFLCELRQLVTLSPAQGGGLPNLRLEAPNQFAASVSISASHVEFITTQSIFMVAGLKSREELRRHLQTVKMASAKSRMERIIDATLSPDVLQLVNQLRDKSASSWLTAVPLVDHGLVLNKQEFSVRGSRSPFRKIGDFIDNCRLNFNAAVIH